MKKRWILLIAALLLSAFLPACAVKEESSALLTLKELPAEQEEEKIGNQIPQWVLDADWNVPFYVRTSSDLQKFDAYAKEHFADYSDPYWTREQSDAVYLGQGIELFALDGEAQMNRIIYYPVMLNGVIVSGYEVYELLDSHEIGAQGGPVIVNELNALMALTSEEMPAILGYNHQNLIAVIGDCYYVLDIDHMDGSEVVTEDIPAMEGAAYTVVDAVKPFCRKQTAQGEDASVAFANPVHHCARKI